MKVIMVSEERLKTIEEEAYNEAHAEATEYLQGKVTHEEVMIVVSNVIDKIGSIREEKL